MARLEELEEHDLCRISALYLYTLVFNKALALVEGFLHDSDIRDISHTDSLHLLLKTCLQ